MKKKTINFNNINQDVVIPARRKRTKGFTRKFIQDPFMPDGVVLFFNENNMHLSRPVFTPTLWNRIQHFFGKHFYVWYEEKCQYPNCKKP
jgi:hypothetical protein